MSRGVGALNVSVNANTAQAVQNLRTFSNEARSTAATAREMSQAFRGNQISDYMARFAGHSKSMNQAKAAAQDLAGTIVDLRNQTSRYNELSALASQARKASTAMSTLAAASKAIAVVGRAAGVVGMVVTVGQLSYELYRNKNAWNEWGTSLGRTLGLIEKEGQRADEVLQRVLDAKIAKQNADRAAKDAAEAQRRRDTVAEGRGVLATATRDRRVAEVGKETVEWEENRDKYGLVMASKIAEQQDRQKTIEAQQEKAKEAAEKRREMERKREQEHQASIRRAFEEQKRQAETVQELRNRVADFFKTDLDRERDQMLRNVSDMKNQAEIRWQFSVIGEMEKLKADKKILRNRNPESNKMLDARSTEGWTQLRKSMHGEKDKVAQGQLAELREIKGALRDRPKEEVFRF